jgi:hypothetical protein
MDCVAEDIAVQSTSSYLTISVWQMMAIRIPSDK